LEPLLSQLAAWILDFCMNIRIKVPKHPAQGQLPDIGVLDLKCFYSWEI
jgi:hypothetical protein